MDLELDGRVGIVTGAGRGLGRAMVHALTGEGARLVAADRTVDLLEALAKEVSDDAVRPTPCDATDIAAAEALVDRALDSFGRIDFVVNNAGVAPPGELLEQDADLWRHTFEINVVSPAMLSRRAAREFVEQGSGKVNNNASISGVRGKARLAAYSASKAAMVPMSEALAAEWAGYGIQVNAIAPGAFKTAAQFGVVGDPDLLEQRIAKIPAKRMAEPEEIGPLVCYLASPASDFVTGSTFVIDGGEAGEL